MCAAYPASSLLLCILSCPCTLSDAFCRVCLRWKTSCPRCPSCTPRGTVCQLRPWQRSTTCSRTASVSRRQRVQAADATATQRARGSSCCSQMAARPWSHRRAVCAWRQGSQAHATGASVRYRPWHDTRVYNTLAQCTSKESTLAWGVVLPMQRCAIIFAALVIHSLHAGVGCVCVCVCVCTFVLVGVATPWL